MIKLIDSTPFLNENSKSSNFRFVICVDVQAKSLNSAYSKLYDSMKGISSSDLEWESTDEAYFEDGEEVDPNFLEKARKFKIAGGITM